MIGCMMLGSAEGCREPANLFLRSLSRRDAALLRPMLIPVRCRGGEYLNSPSSERAIVYFPETCMASLAVGANASSVGVVGSEGLIGWAALIAGGNFAMTARVLLSGGDAYAIPACELRGACVTSPTLVVNLLNFLQNFSLQMGAAMHSALSDSLDTRLSAWLLMLHDRVDGDAICITHDALAMLLHVRRATITDALHRLEGRHAVCCTRNRISVRDRGLLETLAGGSYGGAEQAYRSSIGPFGKSPTPVPSAIRPTPSGAPRLATVGPLYDGLN